MSDQPKNDSSRDLLVEVAAGESIFEQGESGETMYIVEEGEVDIVLPASGGEDRLLATLSRGDFFGEMAVLESEPRTASARARTDCRLLPVRGSSFIRLLQRNPELSVRMMRKLSARLRDVERRLEAALDAEPELSISEAPPPPPNRPPATAGERLIDPQSGLEFALLADCETLVGRPDAAAGTVPDVDLSGLDKQHSVSRRHAKLIYRDGRVCVLEETGTVNGTFVNRSRIEPGEPVPLSDGDGVTFGAVELVFRAG